MVSQYKKLTVYMEPALKAQLHAAAAILGIPAWQVVGDAVRGYLDAMPKADREALGKLAERFLERTA